MSLPGRTNSHSPAAASIDGAADLAEAAEAVRLAFEHQHPGRDPGRRPRPELDPRGAGVEVGVGRAGEARALQPDPALGVLAAPVVADHPRPAVELDRLAVDFEPAVEAGVRDRARRTSSSAAGLVEPVRRQVPAGLGVAGEAQVPGGGQSSPPTAPRARAGADLGVGDLDPAAGGDGELAPPGRSPWSPAAPRPRGRRGRTRSRRSARRRAACGPCGGSRSPAPHRAGRP